MRRSITGTAVGVLTSLLIASTAFATDCLNASKPDQEAGAQIVVNAITGEIAWLTPGVVTRIEQGLVDPVTGEGFHGLVAVDLDGDGTSDFSTWLGVGPEGNELPDQAQLSGPVCRGITNVELYAAFCLAG